MDRLMETLNGATSFNPEQRAASMKLLEQWEVEPNYHLLLQVNGKLIKANLFEQKLSSKDQIFGNYFLEEWHQQILAEIRKRSHRKRRESCHQDTLTVLFR